MQKAMRKRCKRYNVPGHMHHLTFSCLRRQQFLTRSRTPRWFIDALRAALIKHDYSMFAWVIMPEHVHLLVNPPPPAAAASIRENQISYHWRGGCPSALRYLARLRSGLRLLARLRRSG